MSKRKGFTQMKNPKNKLFNLLTGTTCAIALATTVNIANPAFAQVTSTNLPVPNSVVNATLQYNNGVTAQTSVGGLVTNQAVCKAAADTGKTLNIDLGATANSIADIGYNSFNIGSATNNGVIGVKTVNFNFGAADQVAINRVTPIGSAYASKIYGSITQTGQGGSVFLINPNGILFGQASSVNLNSFVASTFRVKDNDLDETERRIELKRSGNPAGIYFEGPGNIATQQSAVFAANSIYNKNKNMSAANNLSFITGDGVTLEVFSGGAVDFPLDDITGHDYVQATTSSASNVVLPNNVSTLLGSINLKAGTLTTGNLKVIAKMNKDLGTEYQDIVNISSVLKPGSVFMYANNAGEEGNLNINTGNIIVNSNGLALTLDPGDIEITTDGKITTGDIRTYGDVRLGTNNLFNNFGPTDEQSENMAEDYILAGLTGDSIKTGTIEADSLIAIGKSIEMKDLDIDDFAILVGVESLTAQINNAIEPFGINFNYQGGAVTVRNVEADTFIAIGSSIDVNSVDADLAILAAISELNLDIAYDLSTIHLDVAGGTINVNDVETDDAAILYGASIDFDSIESDGIAALLAIECLNADLAIDPSILGIDISPFMTGNINEAAVMSLVNLVPGPTDSFIIPGVIIADGEISNGTINGQLLEADYAVALASAINITSVDADDLAVILGIDSAQFHFDAGMYLPYTLNFTGSITGGSININDLAADVAIELAGEIVHDTVVADIYAGLAVQYAELAFQFTEGNVFNFTTLAQDIVSLLQPSLFDQAYLSASLAAENGTISINSITSEFALLLGQTIDVAAIDDVEHLLKIELPSINISYNPQDAYEY